MKKTVLKIAVVAGKILLSIGCIAVVCLLTVSFAQSTGASVKSTGGNATDYAMADRFNMHMTNTLSDAMDGVLSIKKVYWLSDDDLVSPEPNQACFGEASDPAELAGILKEAAPLLAGQSTLFSVHTQIWEGSRIQYYYDETILVITWKQVMDDCVYTISEVKIADPSQFRRFVADGQYASSSKYVATEMAAAANAVVAANGDFYSFRNMGIIVYDSQLMRMEGYDMDTCFIDKNGDIKFAHRGQMTDREETQAFLDENGVRFSLAFGPVLIENGQMVDIKHPYPVGEGDVRYARAALCQMDSLHYLLVAANEEGSHKNSQKMEDFAYNLLQLGCKQAYNLDGGQSATIVMNDKKVNNVWLRKISDIIYFATAIPDGE